MVAGEYTADTYGAVFQRLGDEIDDFIEMLQVGYSERKTISRSTPGVNLFDNFEAIATVENEEVIAAGPTSMTSIQSRTIDPKGEYSS